MNEVFFLLGSNLGDRNFFLQQAIAHIKDEIGPVTKASSIYETQSWGKTDLPDYLNQVVLVTTQLTAREALEKILAIEHEIGRVREEKWGARIIDIDILFFNSEIIDELGLHVPHPELHKRRFTLDPMVELAPTLMHPVLKKEILQLKNELNDSLIVKKL
ncbi:MAG: 2-amino-4-hydroxy-6-hydroxymethyldihydropteridine diphosphokinase [Mucilaginibacter sp.]